MKKVVKPLSTKGLESGISHAGDKLGKKAAQKSCDLIMKQLLASKFNKRKKNNRTEYSCQTRGISRHDIESFDIWIGNNKKAKNYVN